MKKIILHALIGILVLAACTASNNQDNTTAVDPAQPLDTETPPTSLPPTETIPPSPTPTPDLRIIDVDPVEMLLTIEDLAEYAVYFSIGPGSIPFYVPASRNWELKRDYGEDVSAAYVESSGRIDGKISLLQTTSTSMSMPEFVISQAVIFQSEAGPQVDRSVVKQVTSCNPEFMETKTIDIGITATHCYSAVNIGGVTSVDMYEYYNIYGVYKNILYGVTAFGKEKSFSADAVVILAELMLDKILDMPLADQVSYQSN
jgi:hypothetical protein